MSPLRELALRKLVEKESPNNQNIAVMGELLAEIDGLRDVLDEYGLWNPSDWVTDNNGIGTENHIHLPQVERGV